jgi:hypothetical protein
MVWTTYKERIKRLSQRIVECQRPIRILDAIKWPSGVEAELKKAKFRSMPKIGPEEYARIDLGFDPITKKEEFSDIIADVKKSLGDDDAIGQLLIKNCEQYILACELILARGTPTFFDYSRQLYGSPKDKFYEDDNTVCDLGRTLYEILNGLADDVLGASYPENIEAEDVVSTLNERFKDYFTEDVVQAKLSDGIVADAAAGGAVQARGCGGDGHQHQRMLSMLTYAEVC